MPVNCPVPLHLPTAHLWKTFRSKPNAIPPGDSKLFAFPTGIVFTFRPECCSESQRNRVRLHTGIAFAFDRIPQKSYPFTAYNLQNAILRRDTIRSQKYSM